MTQDELRIGSIKSSLRQILQDTLNQGIAPWWHVTFHYSDNKISEDEAIQDVRDLKNKLTRIAYQSRDRTIVGNGKFQGPRMIFFNERSRWGTGQFHTHMIMERMPDSINTQQAMEKIFNVELPSKMKSISKWKTIDIQRILTEQSDL
jgi:hypothetical protein